jgi:hypothetical protein
MAKMHEPSGSQNRRNPDSQPTPSWSDEIAPAIVNYLDFTNHAGTIQKMDIAVSEHLGARSLLDVDQSFVFDFLSKNISAQFVRSVQELAEAAGRIGYTPHIQFFRCDDRTKTPPLVITFVETRPYQIAAFGVPNLNLIFDTPDPRLRGEREDPAGQKKVKVPDGSGVEGGTHGFSHSLRFEHFSAPVRIVLSPSTDTQLHRPFDISVQYSQEAFEEAKCQMTMALKRGEGADFNHLLDCIAKPAIGEALALQYPEFGPRGSPEILPGSFWDDDGMHVMVRSPRFESTKDIDAVVKLTSGLFVEATVVELGSVNREEIY